MSDVDEFEFECESDCECDEGDEEDFEGDEGDDLNMLLTEFGNSCLLTSEQPELNKARSWLILNPKTTFADWCQLFESTTLTETDFDHAKSTCWQAEMYESDEQDKKQVESDLKFANKYTDLQNPEHVRLLFVLNQGKIGRIRSWTKRTPRAEGMTADDYFKQAETYFGTAWISRAMFDEAINKP